MTSKLKTYPVFTKTERENWDEKMGKNYLQAGNFRKTTKDKIQYDLKIGEIGELRVVESVAGAGEFYTTSDYRTKAYKTGILEEFLVVSGSVEVFFENVTYKLKKGQILIFDNTNPPTKFKITKEAHVINIYMPLTLVKSWIPRIYDKLESKLLSPPSKSAELLADYLKLLAQFAIESKTTLPIYQPKAIIPLIMANLSMLVFALADLEEDKPTKIKDIQLDAAKQFMLVHVSDSSVSPKVIAKELGISVRYLHWLFKHSEETVTQYLTRKRIELAQLLLTSSSKSLYSVTEVAFMCGFNDSTHFSRRFKQQVGYSPSIYRAKNFSGDN